MAPAMPCKISKNSQNWMTRGKTNDFKSKFAYILEASESTRMRMEESLPKYHEDHIAGKGDNSLQHYNLVHKFIPMRQAMKQQWIKNGRNLNRFRRGTWQTSEVNQRWSMKQGRRAQKFILPHWWTSAIWRMPNWRQSTKNIKVELYSEATLWKMILDLMQYLQNKGLQHHKWRQQKSWISFPDCQGAQDKAADAVSACIQVKMEDAPKLLKIPKSECPDIWIRLPRHKWPKSWSSKEDPVFPLERNLYGHPLARLSWERQFEKILLAYGWEKVSNWECLFVHREKGYSYLCMWVTSNWLERNKIINPLWKVLNKEVDLGEPTSFLDHV